MKWKLLFGGVTLGVIVVVVVVILVVVAAIGGIWWFVTDERPLLYYDARPANVDANGLSDTGYQEINDTAFNISWSPIPLVGRDIRIRSWVTVYGKGETIEAVLNESGEEGSQAAMSNESVGTVDPEGDALVTVFSMSALQLGPIAFNPVVYAADPGLLNTSGVLIDHAETWLPQNVTNVSNVDVRSTREVTMLGQETKMTTFDGQLMLENESPIDVRIYLARTVKDGELVVALGIAPPDETSSAEFATLVESIEMGEWGTSPGWVPPDPREAARNESSRRMVESSGSADIAT